MPLDTIVDNLRDGVNQLKKGTFQHVDELRADQITSPLLRKNFFYTADANGYRVNRGKVEWGLTRGNDSPILNNIDDAYNQLLLAGNFRTSKDVSDAAFSAKDTLVTDLSQLRYGKNQGEERWVYVEVRTADGFVNTGKTYEAANETEAKVLARMGLTSAYRAELQKACVKKTRIFFLNPGYVQREIAADSKKRDIWLGSWLNFFYDDSDFSAFGCSIVFNYGVRGVRRDVVVSSDVSL